MSVDLRRAAADLAKYQRASEEWYAWADKCKGADREEALRKAIVYRSNCDLIEKATGGKLKALPIRKRIKWRGMSVSIEHPAGSIRKWKDDTSGEEGTTYMFYDYGYLRSTDGVDGDAVDVFIAPDPEKAEYVYVVRQLRAPDFRFYDEDKCMVGFSSADAARNAYLAHYNRREFLGKLDVFPVADFIAAVKKTKRAPAPVGGWQTLMIPQRLEDSPLVSPEIRIFAEDATPRAEAPIGPLVPRWGPGLNDNFSAAADRVTQWDDF